MKYEISDIIQNKYIYGLTILRIHKKANKGVILKMVLKIPLYTNYFIHFLFLIINSMNIIILCGDFIPNRNNTYLSTYLTFLTPFSIVEKLRLTNLSYLIICTIIIIVCIFRYLYLYYLQYKTKNYHITEIYNIKVNFIIVIINHIVYAFFGYIVEFLSFVCYIELFPDKFIIKKDQSLNSCINIIFIIINLLFIIVYNYNNYLSLELINSLEADENYPFQMRLPKMKYIILIFFQNISIFQPLTIFLKNNEKNNISKIINILIDIIIIFLFIFSYLISFRLFNYNNIFNKALSFIGEFSFCSLILEIILYSISIIQNSEKILMLITLIKIIFSISLDFFLEKIYQKVMLRNIKKKLFFNTINNSFNKNVIDCLLYLKEIIENRNIKSIVCIIKFLENHQKFCINKHCGCKIITISSYNESYIIQKIDDYLKKLNYYIESILIKYDFQTNFELSYIISEHLFKNKNNPIMAYSVLQALIHFNYKKLSSKQIVIIYGTMNKYIKYALNKKIQKINIDKFNDNKNELEAVNKENDLKQYFNLLIKIKKLTKLMKEYSLSFNEIIKYKQRYESSIQIELDERDGEIERINSGLLTNSFISELLKFLKDEIIKTNEIKKFLYDLKEYSKLLSYEFIYKCFLFIDFFWNAIIPHELVDVLYGFSNNRNIYSYVINQNIYGLLEELYQYNYKKEYRKYYILLKYTKGIKLSYISETLIRKLNLSKEDLNNHDINSLLIKDLFIPHYYAVNQHFIINQKNVLIDKNVHIFNHKKYMINCVLNSTFQIGMNKNILIICTIQLNERNNKISFFAEKNLKIISINQNFENKFHLSLALIEELKIEIKDLFGIVKNNIIKKYKKEIKAFKEVKHFIKLDPKQYLLKNIFNSENIKDNFRLLDENIFNKYNKENEKDNKLDDDDEKNYLNQK